MTNKKIKILLAEDDKYVCHAYKDSFERAGFDMVIALDGAEAMQKIKEEKPDLILLDLIMPIKSGVEVLMELRADETLKSIPVIVLSNLSEESESEETRALGAVGYLVKSDLSMKEVIDSVKDFLTKNNL